MSGSEHTPAHEQEIPVLSEDELDSVVGPDDQATPDAITSD